MRCLEHLAGIVRTENAVKEILLAREIEIVYDKKVVGILTDLARLICLAREMAREGRMQEQCRRCTHNPTRLSEEMVRRLLSGSPLGTIQHPGTNGNSSCNMCAERSNRAIDAVRNELRRVERKVAREVFMVLSDD